MALFCTAIKRDSVSLEMFPFDNYVHVFSCTISAICCLKYPYSCFSSYFYFFLKRFYCFPVCSYVDIAVIGCRNSSFVDLFCTLFESLNCSANYLFFFFQLLQGLVFWPGLSDLFVSQKPREFCVSHSPRRILVCTYAIWSQFFAQFPVDYLLHPVDICLCLPPDRIWHKVKWPEGQL